MAVTSMLTIGSKQAKVTILADKGADIYAFVDRRTGIDVLFKTPWGRRRPGPWSECGSSMERWMGAYAGGWQVLLPNGGDECIEYGKSWSYHGEAALAAFDVVKLTTCSATLETRLFSVPLYVRREFVVDGPVLRIVETVTNESCEDLEVMWVHHPAFGSPFLESGCLLSVGCATVVADNRAPGSLLAAGSRHDWPQVETIGGDTTDLRVIPSPRERRSILAYLEDFSCAYFAITNPRLRLGVGIRWPIETFPKAWLWQEVHSSPGWPWYRRAYVVAVEPASTVPGQGMARARMYGETGVQFASGSSREVVVEAVLFEGADAATGIEEGGRVRFG